jgi:F-type H+-transporting ATPase subunit alpha
MSSNKFNAGEILNVLSRQITDFDRKVESREVGQVLEVGDGIARCYGLSQVMAGELVDFPEAGVKGLAFNLEESSVAVIVLGDYLKVREGMEVRTTGELLSVPVGEGLIGRVVDPLGNPLDGKGPIMATKRRLVESPAPGIVERQPVKQPLQTGIKAIDAMTPIGRGQRELIIGDRKTGKTAIAIDTIINQREENVICVYVACGQMESKVAGVVEILRKTGAMDYTIVVVASASDAAPLQYIAPYAGTAMAEYFMYEHGRDTSRCWFVGLPGVRPTPATCSTATPASSSAARSSPSTTSSWMRGPTPRNARLTGESTRNPTPVNGVAPATREWFTWGRRNWVGSNRPSTTSRASPVPKSPR